jgi:hypothetical protein
MLLDEAALSFVTATALSLDRCAEVPYGTHIPNIADKKGARKESWPQQLN